MLDYFRNASKSWVIKVLFGVLILSFVAWGVEDVARNGLFGRGPAIKVGDRQFAATEVMYEFKRDMDQLQPQFGGKLSPADARKLGLMDRTIETIVTRTLVDEAGRELGLASSEEQVVAKVASEPSFRNQMGQFDRDLLRQALARAGWSEQEFMRQERDNIVRSQVAESVSGGVNAPAALTDPLIRWNRETRVASIVAVRSASLPQPAAPDAATLEAYYKANASNFMAPEFRAVTAILVRTADAARDVVITDDMVAEAFASRADEFHTPERRTVTQIVLADEGSADKAAELVKAGKDLKTIAKEVSVNVVDLGVVEKGDLPDELAGPVFAVPQGGLTAPVKSPLGWHVARVAQVSPERNRTLAEVKDQLVKELQREKAQDRMGQLANQIEDSLGGGATLEDTATRMNLALVRIPALDSAGRAPNGKPVANLPGGEAFLDVAFHTEQGTEGQLTEMGEDGLFLLRVDSVTPPQPKALAEVRADVVAAWQTEQRLNAAKDLADKIAERVKAGEPLAKVAQTLSLKVDSTAPFTREGGDGVKLPGTLVTALFDGKPGSVATASARDGWIVAQLDKVVPFDATADSKAAELIRRRTSQAVTVDLIDQYIAALNAQMGVKIDRSQLAREE